VQTIALRLGIVSPRLRDRLPFSVGDRKAYRVLADKVVGTSSAELAAYVTAEIPKWAALARQAGVKPE
jgi:hypothetical protein